MGVGWGGVGCRGHFLPVFSFLGPPSRILLGHFHGIVNISSESSAQAPSNDTLLGCIGLRGGGGGCGIVQKSEAHALECRPLGESSQ